jgi:hypothetical protein
MKPEGSFTVFIRARHWSLSWVRWIQSSLSYHVSLRSFLILCHPCLGVPNGLFPFGFSDQNFICISNLFYPCYVLRSSHLLCFDHPKNICLKVKIIVKICASHCWSFFEVGGMEHNMTIAQNIFIWWQMIITFRVIFVQWPVIRTSTRCYKSRG